MDKDITVRRAGTSRHSDAVEFRVIYIACFVAFLFAAFVERLLPRSWRRQRSDAERKSILQQAKEAAGTCATYAFMG